MLKPLTFLSFVALAACTVAAGGGAQKPAATSVTVVRSEAAEPFKLTRVEGTPPEFVAEWTQQMPTPGWTFEIDAVDIVKDRIVAKLTEVRPEGMAVQMIAPGTAKIPLGSLTRGHYVFEIRSRRDTKKQHRPTFAAVIVAR